MRRSSVVRRCWSLLSQRDRRRGALVTALAAGVSLLEAVSAVLILFLLQLVTEPEGELRLPLVGDVRERFGGASDEQFFAIVAGGLGLFFVFRACCVLAQTYLQQRVCHAAGVDLSARLVERYLGMPFVEHQRRNSADLVRNAYTTVTEVVVYALLPIVMMLSEGLLVVAVVAVLLVTQPLATAAAMVTLGPAVLLLARAVRPRLTRLGEESQAAASDSLRTLNETLDGIRDITVLEVREHFHARFVDARRRFAHTQYVRTTMLEVPRLAVETLAFAFILAFLAITTSRGDAAEDSIVVLGLFAYAVLRVMPSVNRIVSNLNTLRFGEAAVDLVHDDLGIPTTTPGRSPVGVTFARSIRLDGVSYRYPSGDRDVLDRIDLEIRRGESIGVVGPTGGGKSTLLDLLLGLLEPTAGAVLVDDVDVRGDLVGWHAHLGVVPQGVFLLDDSLRRNIALGVPDVDVDERALQEAVTLAQLDEVVRSLPLGLDTNVGERGSRLSGGQRQRVAIARALYRRPDVLVFDEGTSALDNQTEAEVVRAISTLKGDRTIVTVAHRLTTVESCDRIIVVVDGRIDDQGTYAALQQRHAAFGAPEA